MGRPAYGARATCESCKSIDVRRWHREGRLSAGQYFTCSWTYSSGERSGSINVSTEPNAVVLTYHTRRFRTDEWKTINQRIPIVWTDCHFGGRRPWFVCSVYSDGQYCGRRVAVSSYFRKSPHACIFVPTNACAAYMKSPETAAFRASWDASLASSEISDKLLAGSRASASGLAGVNTGLNAWRLPEMLKTPRLRNAEGCRAEHNCGATMGKHCAKGCSANWLLACFGSDHVSWIEGSH